MNPALAKPRDRRLRRAAIVAILAFASVRGAAQWQPDQAIYTDNYSAPTLDNGWQSYPWATIAYNVTSPVHAGTHSIRVTANPGEAIWFQHPPGFDSSGYLALSFWIHGGASGGQTLNILAVRGANPVYYAQAAVPLLPPPVAGVWRQVIIPLTDLRVPNNADVNGFRIQNAGGTVADFYLDDVTLLGCGSPPAAALVNVNVDPTGSASTRHPIHPEIYGVGFADLSAAGALRYPVNVWGAAYATRYNHLNNRYNRGDATLFINRDGGLPGQLIGGAYKYWEAGEFLDKTRAGGGQPAVTLPTIGWVAKDAGQTPDWGFSVAKYGAQQCSECDVFPTNTPAGCNSYVTTPCNGDAGNGVQPDGTTRDVPAPGGETDTSVAAPPAFDAAWMQEIGQRTGTAAQGGVKYFILDNEPGLWSEFERDLQPARLGYDAEWNSHTVNFVAAIKAQDPAAKVFGPSEWGWPAYFCSDNDRNNFGCGGPAGTANPASDFQTHTPHAHLDWYLTQAKNYETANGVRPIDYLGIHYYPQAPAGVNIGLSPTDTDESCATSTLRLQSLKSLYDPAYVDDSDINDIIRLVPRLRQTIANNYPGTKLAIMEYNWGGFAGYTGDDMGLSSALAQAEVLAIFGREQADMAVRMDAPLPGSRVEDAFKMFLNYDGNGTPIGGDSVPAASDNVDAIASYAIHGYDGNLYLLLVNHGVGPNSAALSVAAPGITGDVKVYGFDGANRYKALGTISNPGNAFTTSLPARSLRLAVAALNCTHPTQAVAGLRLSKLAGALNLGFTWTDNAAFTLYGVLEAATPGGPFSTQTGGAASGAAAAGLKIPMPAGSRFYTVRGIDACGISTN